MKKMLKKGKTTGGFVKILDVTLKLRWAFRQASLSSSMIVL